MKVYTSRRTRQDTLIELGSDYGFTEERRSGDLFIHPFFMLVYTFKNGDRVITPYPYTKAGLSRAVDDFYFL